ncbi:ABC transporter substrate-binding protein [Pradoshia sp.]
MEPKLLTLWHHVKSGPIKMSDLSDLLGLSIKQTTRYIHKWHDQGWLIYQGGVGRGRPSEIKWRKNVEETLEKMVQERMEKGTIEECARLLLMDWSMDCKLRLMKSFQGRLGYEQNHEDRLIIPRKYPFITIHPLEARDVHSATLVANIYDRLVSIDEGGRIYPGLAHSWEQDEAKLRLYLRKDVKFHDGSILTAEDVCICLEKMRSHPFYELMWSPVAEITAKGSLVVDLHFRYPCSYALHLLSVLGASMYKESGGGLSGTGSFYIESNDEVKTVLHAFKEYYKERPILDVIEYVQVPKDFENIYRSSAQASINETFKVDSDYGFGVAIFNSYRDSDIARADVREYLHYKMAHHRGELTGIDPNIIPNDCGVFPGISRPYVMKKKKCPPISRPLKLQVTSHTNTAGEWAREIFSKDGCVIELVPVRFEETLNNGLGNQECDFFFHGEVFEINQSFSFFQFLFGGSSPLNTLLEICIDKDAFLKSYAMTPVSSWMELHLSLERRLIESSHMVPLYFSKKRFLFTEDIMNVKTKYFGHADFSKLWMKPLV